MLDILQKKNSVLYSLLNQNTKNSHNIMHKTETVQRQNRSVTHLVQNGPTKPQSVQQQVHQVLCVFVIEDVGYQQQGFIHL